MNLEDSELLVIGTSGHSAKYFFERLAKENYQKKIKCLLRSHSQIDHLKCYDLNLEFIYVDFDDIDSIKTSMQGVKILLNIAGIRVSENFMYTSNNNKEWMEISELQQWIEKNKNKIGNI